MPDSVIQFILSPDNAWILYAVAVFFILDGILLYIISKRAAKNNASNANVARTVISLSSISTIILGLILALLTYLINR